jgi:hypothetical protein
MENQTIEAEIQKVSWLSHERQFRAATPAIIRGK